MNQEAFPARIRLLLTTQDPPELGPGPRRGVQSVASLEASLNSLLSEEALPGAAGALLRALILLWHDHLDESHQIAQGIGSVDGSYVHGVMHRREPDYGNAAYWFRRVGDHPAFPALAERVEALLSNQTHASLRGQLLRAGRWQPFAFIDACERAAEMGASAPEAETLRAVQAAEFEVLLEHFLRPG